MTDYETQGSVKTEGKDSVTIWPRNDIDKVRAEIREVLAMVSNLQPCPEIPGQPMTTDAFSSPTRRVRVNIAKYAKRYTIDTTVEITAHGDDIDIETELRDLLGLADTTARDEIDIRERIDAGDAGARSREIAAA